MLVIIGRVRVDEAELDDWTALIERLVAESRDEPGCVSYTFGRDIHDPTTFHIAEEWTDREALLAHLGSAHFREWSRAVKDRTVHERVANVYEATKTSLG